MLVAFLLNFVCRFASQESFPTSCYNSSQRILFSKIDGILKFVKIREFYFLLYFILFFLIRKIRIINLSVT